jgi:hypothetical protein
VKARVQGFGKAWTWASIAGVVVIVWLAFQIKGPDSVPVTEKAASSAVGLVDPGVIKSTMLFDLAPLFLPTEYNSSRRPYVPTEPGGSFAGFSFKPTFSDSQIDLHLPPPVEVPSSPAEALVGDPPGAPFIGFGRIDIKTEPLARRAAYVEITDAESGKDVFSEAVSDARPPSPGWRPMEFMAAVDAAGLVGPPVLTVHSDVAEVDVYFGRYLADGLRIGQRLNPGFYRIRVGP